MSTLSKHQTPDIFIIKRSSRLRVGHQWHLSDLFVTVRHRLLSASANGKSIHQKGSFKPHSAVIKLSAVAASAEPDGRFRRHQRTRLNAPCDLGIIRLPPRSATDVDRLREVSLLVDLGSDPGDRQR